MFNKSQCMKKRHRKLLEKGRCHSHPKKHLAPGKKVCQICLDRAKERYKKASGKDVCPGHAGVPRVAGKSSCQVCLDNSAINGLPKNCRPAARKKAEETRKARIDGTYVCPILGKTEDELSKLFPAASNKSVWDLDHIGETFRDIISRRANHSVGTLTSEQLLACAAYVKKHEL